MSKRLCYATIGLTFSIQTHPVGFGRPPYLVIGFIGPDRHILNIAF